jgi:hypothetical protein
MSSRGVVEHPAPREPQTKPVRLEPDLEEELSQ